MRHFWPFLVGLACISPTRAILNAPFGQYVDRCPSPCTSNPSNWARFYRVADLDRCDKPLLFDLNVHNLVDDPATQVTIRTCTPADGEHTLKTRDAAAVSIDNDCGAKPKQVTTSGQVGPASKNMNSPINSSDISSAASQLAAYLQGGASCGSTILFAKAGDAVAGLYVGAEVQKTRAVALVEMFQDQRAENQNLRMFQICDANDTAARTFGLFAGGMADLASVQDAVKTWTNAQCLESDRSPIEGVKMDVLVSSIDSSEANATRSSSLHRRAECRDIQVESGDSCASLATQCGISGADFTEYNPAEDFCSTLMPKQYVCCSAGDLPDHSPQPGEDGTCFTYTVQKKDTCWDIANSFSIDVSVIEDNNNNTWAWGGCDALKSDQLICLSPGDRPFPNSLPEAVCGPQVNGTVEPTDGTPWAELNPCPLKACCDVHGFCGVTEEFCTPNPADTGAPGTAKPNTNGCISNCGTDIANNGDPPATFRRVGYFEAWNNDRSCLHMDVSQIDTSDLTHIHFAFATVTEDWKASVADVKDQFQKFRDLDADVKKIVSFGGWAFSTDASTFQRFRDATKPENRETFATEVVAFFNDNDLDGLDFDWEYPGAPDIPGIPPGTKEEAVNYLEFLKLVRNKLPDGAELAIALPASFWYLKQYPVDKMESVVDYFIYMTYDFHGQWDVGNEWSTPGCKGGNCLRSHINITETTTALSMITKAGVKSNKVLVGITSYGRSFRMSDSSCSGPMCTYTGTANSSNAYPGRCTDTAGYISNAELNEIIDNPGDHSLVESSYHSGSDSNILIYGTEEKADWVAYMDSKTKKSRVDWIRGLNFGGSTDWAVDLMEFVDDDDDDDDDEGGVCDPADGTYDGKTDIPQGEYYPTALLPPSAAADSSVQYITIVNLTPHKFVLEDTHSYQMDQFKFGDIPQGRARQNVVEYMAEGVGSIVDTNGEAYYKIEGTDKKFVIRATTHIPATYTIRTVFDLSGMDLGQREYKNPDDEVPVTLVITGSKSYGFIASLRHGPGNWMREMYDVIKDREIQHLVMPGTHNSGMSRISGQIISGGSVDNTQTQALNIYDQLRAGARWFDLRIASVHETANEGSWEFWALHVNNEMAQIATGNSGNSLGEIIDEINQFTDENPGEVIFFRVRYLVGIRKVPSLGPIDWEEEHVDDFFKQLKKVNNRCGDLKPDEKKFPFRKASYFMDQNEGAGCVIFLLDGHIEKTAFSDGIYDTSVLPFVDNWSEMENAQPMAEDQIETWQDFPRPDTGGSHFLISQWLVTPDVLVANRWGLERLAILPTNPALYWAGVNNMKPGIWPNVLMVDYIGVVVKGDSAWDKLSADLYTLAVGLNLYMISENCDINDGRSPLLPQPSSSRRRAGSAPPPWNGIVFANGTVLDDPPPGLHPGRVEVLRNGTVFSNGTALERDIPNPDFRSLLF